MPLQSKLSRCLRYITVTMVIGGGCEIVELSETAMAEPQSMLVEIEKIKHESSSMKRADHAHQLFRAIQRHPINDINDEIISEIGILMRDRDDAVRLWAAVTLAYIGPRASATIPALESALEEIECIYGSATSEPAIRLALTKMGRTPPRRECPIAE